MATSKTTITSTAHCRSLPPVGAVLLCQEGPDGAAHPYLVTVEKHLGRYFYAAGHRFHVFDDWDNGSTSPAWRTAAATVVLWTGEELATIQDTQGRVRDVSVAYRLDLDRGIDLGFSYHVLMGRPTALPGPAPPSRPVWRPPAPPAGPDEPTETW